MNKIPSRLLVIVLVSLVCGWFVYSKPIRLGKDLRGGVSLIYAVSLPEGAGLRGQEALAQVIDVLKQRVNPQGVLDIAMQPQGNDRIEVVMPLPSPEVRALQRSYKEALAAFMQKAQLSPTELQQALAAGKAAQIFGSDGSRGAEIIALQRAFDDATSAQEELDRAKTGGADAAAIADIENRLVTAQLAETRLRNGLLGQTLPESRVTKALALSTLPQRMVDPQTNEAQKGPDGLPIVGPSPRDRELAAIKADFPHLADLVDPLVAQHDAYMAKRTGLDDPEDLMRLLRGAGVLTFHIAVPSAGGDGVNVTELRDQLARRGPKNTDSAVARWFEINDLKQWYETPGQLEALRADPVAYFGGRGLAAAEYAGSYYVLLFISDAKSMTHASGDPWAIKQVYRTTDPRLGGAAVGFQLDTVGGGRMARITGPNVNRPMAIVLDGQVYSAPNLQSAIAGSGIISGKFSDAEISYLIRVLTAGSLEASLSPDPISINILGPSIGADNLELGREAIIYSVAFTCLLMLLYYFLAGVVANIGLAINTLIIFGVMAAIDGTFTLPGLAGIALSVAMAVDANVLIYERIREEQERGESLRGAVQLGYARALSAIVDGNITNLIAVIVLYKVGATEVKGFALTMSIGVIATLFTGLFVSRTCFMVLTDWFGMKRIAMLPTVLPAVRALLTPKVDWIAIRSPLWAFCAVVAVASLVTITLRGRDIFETEFRGGVAMTLDTRQAKPGEAADGDGRLILNRGDVERRVHALGEAATTDPILFELRSANIVTLGEAGKEAESTSFQIRVGNPTTGIDDESKVTRAVVEAVVREFKDQIDVQLPLEFTGAGDRDHAKHTFALEKDLLGESIGRADIGDPLGDFRGGVAVVIDGITPPTSTESVSDRIARMRSQPDFADAAGRKTKVVGLVPADASDPAKGYTSVAVLVSDPGINSLTAEFEAWDRQLAAGEWKLVSSALQQQASLTEVSSFSPIVAENLAASAVVAVVLSMIGMLVYIWVRFGSFRFSSAAIVSLAFNVVVCLGFIAAAPWIARSAFGPSLYIQEFRIDLNVVAALLTIVGYAINDTIVILDRIRENRGKLSFVTRTCVNNSVNQTFSRTVLTGGSTLATAVILIVLGGTGIRPFAYTFLVGLIAGTFSSVVIAAPMVYSRREEEEARRRADLTMPTGPSASLAAPA